MAAKKQKPPKVRIARPKGRPYQLRYTCPNEKREIRISTGTRDEFEVQEQKRIIEAKLLLGIDGKPKRRVIGGPRMQWDEFREMYRETHLSTLRESSAYDYELRLDVAQRIIKPRTLGDMADRFALHDLQNRLLAGEQSDRSKGDAPDKPRSPHTVKTYMTVVLASLHWAEEMGWLPAAPKIRKVKVSKLKHMKGRPITLEEFERMVDVVPKVVGENAAESWRHVLYGLWESGLRIGELLDVSWNDHECIRPDWERGVLPVLAIPHAKQKNATEESIPLLPGFEAVLLETPRDQRRGYVFDPQPTRQRVDYSGRLTAKWASRVVSEIGQRAGVVVEPATSQKPAKYASAHDLRRSCAERLLDAGVPEREVARVLRHADIQTTRRHYAPGTVQKSAGILRMYLGTDGQKKATRVTPERKEVYTA